LLRLPGRKSQLADARQLKFAGAPMSDHHALPRVGLDAAEQQVTDFMNNRRRKDFINIGPPTPGGLFHRRIQDSRRAAFWTASISV